MNDDLTLLASAYLDGEATADERARVEADVGLLDEVERLRTARTALLDPSVFERPNDDVREAAIRAALTAWDVVAVDGTDADAPAVEHTSSVVPFVRRVSSTRWLTAAAAIVAVAGLGVVITQMGGSDDDSSVAFDAPAATAARAEGDTALTEQFEQPAASEDALLSNDVAADDAGGTDPDASPPAEMPTAAASGTASLADTNAAAESAEAPDTSLETLDELAAFAVAAKQTFDSGQQRAAPTPPCAGQVPDGIEYVATGTYRDRQVVIGIDDARATAIDPASCEIVAEAPLP